MSFKGAGFKKMIVQTRAQTT